MQASFVVFFRATVMFACLVVLPLIAVTGSGDLQRLKPVVHWCRGFLERTWASNKAVAAQSPPSELGAAPSFPPRRAAADVVPTKSIGLGTALPPMAVRTEAPPIPAATVPTGPPRVGLPPPSPVERGSGGSVALEGLERRLRDLGATYYLLEKWGDAGGLYRFHCRMALADNPEQYRYFESTDRDPERAMADVVRQVEQWRSEQVR